MVPGLEKKYVQHQEMRDDVVKKKRGSREAERLGAHRKKLGTVVEMVDSGERLWRPGSIFGAGVLGEM